MQLKFLEKNYSIKTFIQLYKQQINNNIKPVLQFPKILQMRRIF